MRTRRSEVVLGHLLLAALGLGVVVPFLALVLAAFNPPGSALTGMTWPDRFSWGNIATAWTEGHFSTLVVTSVRLEVIVVPLTLVLATLAGYGLSALRTPWKRIWSLLFLLGMTLPIEVVLVPLYLDLRSYGLTDSLLTLALVEAGAFLPFGVYWMRTAFLAVPDQVVEAAEIDGAGPWARFQHLFLPLAGAPITTLGVIYFMWCWNQFLLVMTLMSDVNQRTAPAGLGFFVDAHSTDIPLLAAATLIVITPMLIVYIVFQRRFIAGLMRGVY
jgi:raffinose/stachyose/melibiose transport system permease protein